MMTRSLVAALASTILIWTGCVDDNPLYQPGPQLPDECRFGAEVSESFQNFERPEKVDLWFVVADSGAMPEYQEALAAAMPSFLQGLDSVDLDVRVAVSTTGSPGIASPGTDGDGCANNSRAVADNSQNDWIETVQCNVQQGGGSDRRQRSLDVTQESLLGDSELLDEFRREDARLVITMVSNEDDCSGSNWSADDEHPMRDVCAWQAEELRSVESWASAIKDSAVTPEGVSLVAISGPPANISYQYGENVRRVCSSSLGSGYPSPRLYRATEYFGPQGLFLSSCVLDFHDHLEEMSRRIVRKDTVTLCASEPMAHEPLAVDGRFEDGDWESIPFGTGFIFQGTTDECPDGAIQLRRDGTMGVDRVQMLYCTL